MTESYYEGQDLEALADLRRYQAWIRDMLRPTGHVMEVGAGTGNFSHAYADDVDELHLVEPSQLARVLEQRFSGSAHVTTHHGTLDATLAAHPEFSERFDCVVSVNVFEHVEDDYGLVRACFQAVKPGGRLLVAVPAMPRIFGSLDELVHHHRRYTPGRLRDIASTQGFRIDEIRYFDVLGVLPWWFTGRVLRSRSFNATMARVYDRLGVPATRLLESVRPPPVGKNLVLVCTKPGA